MSTAPTPSTIASLCSQLGVTGEAELIRRGTNDVYRVGDRCVLRVGRLFSKTRVQSTLNASAELSKHAPVLPPLTRVVASAEQDGAEFFATAWPLAYPSGTPEGLGASLRALHGVETSLVDVRTASPGDLPYKAIQRLENPPEWVSMHIVSYLASKLDARRREWDKAFAAAEKSIVHNDAQASNVVCYDGRSVLIDLDTVAYGPSFYDLVPSLLARTRMDDASAQGVFDAYGDTSKVEEFIQAGVAMREVTSTTWLMTVDSPEHKSEFFKRFDTLVDPGDDRPWEAL